MKELRLLLLNEDLPERFGVLPAFSSHIFTTWIKIFRKVLGKALAVQPPKETIRENLPEIFIKSGYGKCCLIIDCAEVFIERPKSLSAQVATRSNYKHHSTFRFLVGNTPTRFILFLSPCYGGRANDKFITRDSEFCDLLEKDDEVTADRGF